MRIKKANQVEFIDRRIFEILFKENVWIPA